MLATLLRGGICDHSPGAPSTETTSPMACCSAYRVQETTRYSFSLQSNSASPLLDRYGFAVAAHSRGCSGAQVPLTRRVECSVVAVIGMLPRC